MTEQLAIHEETEETLPAVQESAEVATIPDIPEELAMAGLEAMDSSDLVLPRARVLQPTSKLDGERGHFHFNLTGECKPQIKAVLVDFTKTRVYWSDTLGDRPFCASDDTRAPRADYAGKYADACETCPWAQRVNDEPSACQLHYNFLAVDLEDNTPFIITLHGKSIQHAKAILTYFRIKKRALFEEPVIITSVDSKNDKGRFYEITIRAMSGQGPFDWQPYAQMHRAYKAATLGPETERAERPLDDEPEPETVAMPDISEEPLPF